MADNILQKRSKAEIAVDFRSAVTDLESNLKSIANGDTIVAGTEDKPIVTDSKLIPIRHFYT